MYFTVHTIDFQKTFEVKNASGFFRTVIITTVGTWEKLTLGFIGQKNNGKAWPLDSDT